MNKYIKFSGIGLVALPFFLFAQTANAQAKTRFACGVDKNVPATVAILPDGTQAPIIRYVSGAFEQAGYSNQKRCEEISERFQYYNDRKEIDFMTTGRINGQNVICVTRQEGGDCSRDLKSEGLLITVRPGVNPQTTLEQLINVRVQAGSTLEETEARPYVNTKCLIDAGSSQEAYESCTKGSPKLSATSRINGKTLVPPTPAATSKPRIW